MCREFIYESSSESTSESYSKSLSESYFERLNPKLSGILDLVQLEVQYKTTEQNPIQRLYLFLISLILY